MASSNEQLIPVQYVTAFYSIPGRVYQNADQVLTDFQPFLRSSLPIMVFTDVETFAETISGEHIRIVQVPKSELEAFRQVEEETSLPANRNKEKDTLTFLQLMNAKPEFVKRAADLVAATTYVWFDFGVLKVSKQHDRFVKRMESVKECVDFVPNKIIIPGCKGRESIDFTALFSTILWRFCGGIILIPASFVKPFYLAASEQLENCRKLGVLTWEVNLWAAIDYSQPDMFHWYNADHNDSIVEFPLPPKQKRIIFLSMIKNESRIIKRCIQSALPVADAICICDTGSTDTTVEVLTEYFKDFSVPAKVFNGPNHLWKNFGYNRSQSFLAAVEFCNELGWDPEHTYAIALDADMELKPQPAFDKQSLTAIGYKMIQKNAALEYYNTRFLKLGHKWCCTGVTHEYWDGGETDTITFDKMYISDIGDGGCKDDKFERDVRLLEQGLIDSPNNPRYLFYLAQSYKDNQQIDKSIELYKRRITAGGWYEEVWYSMYIIMKLYAQKGQFADMEYWGQKSYEYRKERSENLLYLVSHFRDRRQYYKAWHYYQLGAGIKKPADLLFIETDVYEKKFEYELAILHDYVFPEKKHESMDISIKYFNKWNEGFAYNNIEWFVTRIPGTVRKLQFQPIGDYIPTSTSFCKLNDGMYRVNVRYVNYRIQLNGGYLMLENGVLNGDNPVRTVNYTCLMDAGFNIVSPLELMEYKDPAAHDSRIKGLEDVRIFRKSDSDETLYYVGTTMEYSFDGNVRQHMGIYNVATHTFEQNVSLKPPRPTGCEKNWIPYKGNKFIYGYHPFEIGSLDSNNTLVIESQQATPNLLTHMRGSSTLVEENGFRWGLTHCVIYKAPRKYYHMVIKIDPATDRIVGYTDPFFFVNNAIEYCLGFEKVGSNYTVIVSQNDSNPVMVSFEDDSLLWRSI
jgi:glycosyltransferase involved in cell wall biosynthesis